MDVKRLRAVMVLVCSGMISAGCAVKVTGGGLLVGDRGRATIAVTADSCGDSPKGQFQYVDQTAGVKMHGEVLAAQQCVAGLTDCQCQALTPGFGLGPTDYQVLASYRSTYAGAPGTGLVLACVSDNGQGASASSDAASVHVLDGPFAGYDNYGVLQGNFQQHKCPGKKTGP